jgi:signal peptidase I
MEPTLRENDLIIVSKIPYLFKKPQVNDIVAFRSKNENSVFIKRIKTIKNHKYLVYGDNTKDSYDSNKFGELDKEQIMGKFIYKL